MLTYFCESENLFIWHQHRDRKLISRQTVEAEQRLKYGRGNNSGQHWKPIKMRLFGKKVGVWISLYYRVWLTLDWIIAQHRLLILLKGIRMLSCGIRTHSSSIQYCLLELWNRGCFECMGIGLRHVDLVGQAILSVSAVCRYSLVSSIRINRYSTGVWTNTHLKFHWCIVQPSMFRIEQLYTDLISPAC